MLKRKALRKIAITTFVMFILLTIYFIPSKNKNSIENIKYQYSSPRDISIYLINDCEQLTKVDFQINEKSLLELSKNIINKLTINNNILIPNGLTQLIPKNVKLIDIRIDEGIVYLNFSKEFLEIDNEKIEMVVESISYSLFSVNEITGVSIYVQNENISTLFPKNIPSIITRKYGINRRFELKNLIDISKIVIFYIDNIDDETYYVPITKYVNDKREKIKIIIDELSSNYIYESNLITLLDKNIKLIDYKINDDQMFLNFNNSIFINQDSIVEEVVYSISYSVFSSYDQIEEVVFLANNEEILKKSKKDIE